RGGNERALPCDLIGLRRRDQRQHVDARERRRMAFWIAEIEGGGAEVRAAFDLPWIAHETANMPAGHEECVGSGTSVGSGAADGGDGFHGDPEAGAVASSYLVLGRDIIRWCRFALRARRAKVSMNPDQTISLQTVNG